MKRLSLSKKLYLSYVLSAALLYASFAWCESVVVVGAGLAGLTAAERLRGSGHEVQVFEREVRSGGRVLENADGHILGAELIDSKHEEFLTLIRNLGLTTYDRRNDPGWGRRDFIFNERAMNASSFAHAVYAESRDSLQRLEQDVRAFRQGGGAASRFDSMTAEQYLNQVVPEGSLLRRYLNTMLSSEFGQVPSRIGAWVLLQSLSVDTSTKKIDFLPWHDESIVVQGGTSRVIQALEGRLNRPVVTHHELIAVHRDVANSQYILTFNADGRSVNVRADSVFLSLPLPQLGRVHFGPGVSLPQDLQNASRDTQYAQASKLIFRFDSPRWQNEGHSGRIVSGSGYISWDSTPPGCPNCEGLLTVYPGSNVPLSPEEERGFVSGVLSDLELLHPGVSREFRGISRADWPQAYSYAPRPGERALFQRPLSLRTYRVFFIGEAMSLRDRGYMNGAVDSAIEATDALARLNLEQVNTPLYRMQQGGRVNLNDGALVEGSIRQGGSQPDFRVDLSNPTLAQILGQANEMRHLPFWERVRRVRELVSSSMPNKDYGDQRLAELNLAHTANAREISVGMYAACSVGTCREHGIILHFALKAAGVENELAYVRQAVDGVEESHAVTILKHEGEEWIVDSYERYFNGYRLSDAQAGLTPQSRGSPIAQTRDSFRRILAFNSHPRYFIPERSEPYSSAAVVRQRRCFATVVNLLKALAR